MTTKEELEEMIKNIPHVKRGYGKAYQYTEYVLETHPQVELLCSDTLQGLRSRYEFYIEGYDIKIKEMKEKYSLKLYDSYGYPTGEAIVNKQEDSP